MRPYINLLNVCHTGTRDLGPGLRYAIWVQGCPFNCKGCITSEGIPIVRNKIVFIDELIDDICTGADFSGITISGGEPFLQASKLILLLDGISQRRSDLDVIVFTGFDREELTWPEAKGLLERTDVLIDGKYVDRLNDNIGLRGSSNQRIHYLTGRLAENKAYFDSRNRSVEVHLYDQGYLVIGVPNKMIKL